MQHKRSFMRLAADSEVIKGCDQRRGSDRCRSASNPCVGPHQTIGRTLEAHREVERHQQLGDMVDSAICIKRIRSPAIHALRQLIRLSNDLRNLPPFEFRSDERGSSGARRQRFGFDDVEYLQRAIDAWHGCGEIFGEQMLEQPLTDLAKKHAGIDARRRRRNAANRLVSLLHRSK